MSDMQSKSDEELNRMLAELMGWQHVHKRAKVAPDFMTGYPPKVDLVCVVPHYCSSLDEVANVEAGLTEQQLRDYDEVHLRRTRVADDRDELWSPRKAASYLWHANARQRTIALIAALQPKEPHE